MYWYWTSTKSPLQLNCTFPAWLYESYFTPLRLPGLFPLSEWFSWQWPQLSLALLTRADFPIIIECIQGSRGVPLAGLNLMQSHLFNFTSAAAPTGPAGRKQGDTERGRQCRWERTGLTPWPLASRTVPNNKVESACWWRGRGISACDMSLRWQVLIYIEVDVDVQTPEGSSPSCTLPSLSERGQWTRMREHKRRGETESFLFSG